MSSLWKWLSYEPVQSSPNHRSILYRPSFILDFFLPRSLPQDHTHFRTETMSRPHLKLFHTPAQLDFSFYSCFTCNKVTWNVSQTCWLRFRKQNNIKKGFNFIWSIWPCHNFQLQSRSSLPQHHNKCRRLVIHIPVEVLHCGAVT